jgi:hypothetical protein
MVIFRVGSERKCSRPPDRCSIDWANWLLEIKHNWPLQCSLLTVSFPSKTTIKILLPLTGLLLGAPGRTFTFAPWQDFHFCPWQDFYLGPDRTFTWGPWQDFHLGPLAGLFTRALAGLSLGPWQDFHLGLWQDFYLEVHGSVAPNAMGENAAHQTWIQTQALWIL